MDRLKLIVHECHRRSLWQVLAIYLVGSWGALQAVQGITQASGLPDWVPPGTLILFVIGLPIVLATAFVQEGIGGGPQAAQPQPEIVAGSTEAPFAPASKPRGAQRLFTWRRAAVGGAVAFAVLAVSVGVYTFMWSKGLGSVGSLTAQGAMDERERVLLADFGNATTDSMLSNVVTEALRVDLTESQAITLVDPAYVREVLVRMKRNPNEPFTAELAREAAQRDGIDVVIEGEIGAAGSGYVLTARIVGTADGTVLGAFRETARDSDRILDALDALSQSIRNKAGESLSDIRETGALEQVTTGSLDALRLFTQAEVVSDQGENRRAITLLEEATTLDPEFAMAWRKLGVLLTNTSAPLERRAEAARRAYELRERLTPRERDQASAWYFYTPGPDQDYDRSAQFYQAVLDQYPDDRSALNNLAIIRNQDRDFAGAAELLQRAVNGPGESAVAHANLVTGLYRTGRVDSAGAALDRFAERYPDNPRVIDTRFLLAFYERRWEEADSAAEASLRIDRERPAVSYRRHAMIRVAQGHVADAAPYYLQASGVSAVEAYNAALDQARIQILWLEDPAAARRTVAAVQSRHRLADMDADERPLFALAEVFARMGDQREMESWLARHETERAAAAQGELYQGQRAAVLGHLALARGEFGAAEERYRDARRLQDCNDCYTTDLGTALAGAGKREDALRVLEEGAADRQLIAVFWPMTMEPLMHEQLGQLYEALGRRVDAAAAYEEVVEVWKDADAMLQPRVQRAREKAASLRGAATP